MTHSTRRQGLRHAVSKRGRSHNTRIVLVLMFLIFQLPHALSRPEGHNVVHDSILDATEEQLRSAQAKITYLGPQLKPIATVVFAPPGREVVLARFLQVQQSQQPYDNDDARYIKRFNVSPAEFQRIMATLKPMLDRVDPTPAPTILSFSVICEKGTVVDGREFRIGRTLGSDFYNRLIQGLEPENETGRAVLMKQFRSVYPGS